MATIQLHIHIHTPVYIDKYFLRIIASFIHLSVHFPVPLDQLLNTEYNPPINSNQQKSCTMVLTILMYLAPV